VYVCRWAAFSPLLSVKENINSAIAPNQQVLSSFAKRAIETPLRYPFVDRLGADMNKISELSDFEYRRKIRTRTVGKSLLDFGLGEFPLIRGHNSTRRCRQFSGAVYVDNASDYKTRFVNIKKPQAFGDACGKTKDETTTSG